MKPSTRALAGLAWFAALALVFRFAVRPEESSGGDEAEALVLAGFLAASVIPGALFGVPALFGPPAGLVFLITLYAAAVELPVFASSALWGVGAFFLAGFELFGVGVGIALRFAFLAHRRARDAAPGDA